MKVKNCDLVGIVGRRAFHVFDRTNLKWVCSSRALGYQTLAEAPQDKGSDEERVESIRNRMTEHELTTRIEALTGVLNALIRATDDLEERGIL